MAVKISLFIINLRALVLWEGLGLLAKWEEPLQIKKSNNHVAHLCYPQYTSMLIMLFSATSDLASYHYAQYY